MGHSSNSDDRNTDSNEALLRRFMDGDREAFTRFVRRWESPMFNLAFRIVGQAADAEEVRQNVFVRLVQRAGRVGKVRRADVWIRRCVINEAITFLRRKKRHGHVELGENNELADDSTSQAERDELVQQVQFAMSRLSPEARALLSLRFDEGLTFREIADVLKTPHTTVHGQYQAAIRALRAQLGPEVARPTHVE